MSVTLEQCCAAGVHLTICDDDGYCEFCGHQDPCPTGGPAADPRSTVAYGDAIRAAYYLNEPFENAEYLRGQVELLCDCFGVHMDDKAAVERDVRSAAQAPAERAPNDLSGMTVEAAAGKRGVMAGGNRTIVHTIHTDDGALEIYWTRAGDDFPESLPGFEGYNSVLLHPDGALTWKGWTDNELPISLTIDANRVVVAMSEDAHETETDVVFDSAKLPEMEAHWQALGHES